MIGAVKVITISTVLVVAAGSPVGYVLFASPSSKSKSKGEEWLTNNGFVFNKPVFNEKDELNQNCSENLFSNTKDEADPSSDQKLYGCIVSSMEIYGEEDSDLSLLGKEGERIKGISETALRKGFEGWVINSKIDNYVNTGDSTLYFRLTKYKYSQSKWEKEEGGVDLWNEPIFESGKSSIQRILSNGGTIESVDVKDKNVVIKIDQASQPEELSEEQVVPKKEYPKSVRYNNALAWTDADEPLGKDFLMVNKREYYVNGKKHSQEVPERFKPIQKAEEQMLDKIKNTKGIWIDMNHLCDSRETKGMTQDEQKQLIMYCSNGKKTD